MSEMLYEIYADGKQVGQLFGACKSEAIAKARLIWKLKGYVTAVAL